MGHRKDEREGLRREEADVKKTEKGEKDTETQRRAREAEHFISILISYR